LYDLPIVPFGREAVVIWSATLACDCTARVNVPDLVESSVDVALIVSEPEAGALAGAVYSPELETVPETADQVTVEL
jgi:hypothetical protein